MPLLHRGCFDWQSLPMQPPQPPWHCTSRLLLAAGLESKRQASLDSKAMHLLACFMLAQHCYSCLACQRLETSSGPHTDCTLHHCVPQKDDGGLSQTAASIRKQLFCDLQLRVSPLRLFQLCHKSLHACQLTLHPLLGLPGHLCSMLCTLAPFVQDGSTLLSFFQLLLFQPAFHSHPAYIAKHSGLHAIAAAQVFLCDRKVDAIHHYVSTTRSINNHDC